MLLKSLEGVSEAVALVISGDSGSVRVPQTGRRRRVGRDPPRAAPMARRGASSIACRSARARVARRAVCSSGVSSCESFRRAALAVRPAATTLVLNSSRRFSLVHLNVGRQFFAAPQYVLVCTSRTSVRVPPSDILHRRTVPACPPPSISATIAPPRALGDETRPPKCHVDRTTFRPSPSRGPTIVLQM